MRITESQLRHLVRGIIRESGSDIDLFDERFLDARAGRDPEMKRQLNDLRRAHRIADFSKMTKADWDALSVYDPPHPQSADFSEWNENRPENVRARYLSKGELFGYDICQALGGKRQGMRFIRAVIRDGAAAACQANPKAKALCDKQGPAALADPQWLESALRGAREMDQA
jgi:hypothetical protein